MTNRDQLRGIVSDLQKITGIKKFNSSKLAGKKDCYQAIYEIVTEELKIKKENKILKTVNQALNDINCELMQEIATLKKQSEQNHKTLKIKKKNLIISLVIIISFIIAGIYKLFV